MGNLFLKLQAAILPLLVSDEGQDLVEYALVVALIAFGAVAGMGTLATEINSAFNDVSSELASALA